MAIQQCIPEGESGLRNLLRIPNSTSLTLVEHCGFYVLNLLYQLSDFDNSKINEDFPADPAAKNKALLCGFCLPGFKPVLMLD